jgi:aspartate/methionine/tyrosine aminotransferase
VILHYPCYQSLEEIPHSIGCEITRWVADEKMGWELDLDFLKDNIRRNTRAIIINCPHNPTGYQMDQKKFREIVSIAADKGILLLSDEAYRLLEHDTALRLPAACDLYDDAVSIGVMSKSFGLAGLRIGWAATRNKQILAQMAALKDYTTICSSAPSEYLAGIALRKKDQLIARNIRIVKQNLEILNKLFYKYRHMFEWKQPKAGSVAFPRLTIDTPVDDFCERLVNEKGVLLLPGSCFASGYNNFRIGFGRKNLPECVEKLEQFLEEYY